MILYHWVLRATLLSYKFLFRPRLKRVRCLILHQEKVLLVRHVGGGNEWSLPGGGAKSGESVFDTARREVAEELGIELTHFDSLGAVEIRHEFATLDAEIVRAHAGRYNFTPDLREIREAGWFDVNQFPGDISPLLEWAVQAHKNELAKA